MAKNLLIILGATASGKTQMAVRLAYELNGEIISVDSRQVYLGMDIGTGKDLKEYLIHGHNIPYHLINIFSPEEEFNLYEFQSRFYEIHRQLIQRNVLPVAVGGTGLYLESIIQNYQLPPAPANQQLRKDLQMKSIPELQKSLLSLKTNLHNKTDIEDKERLIRAIEIEKARLRRSAGKFARPIVNAVVLGIRWERSMLRERISVRLRQRLEQGMIQEVEALRNSGLSWAKLDSFGLEYRYLARYLQGQITYYEMFEKLNTSIHQFAKRQETWFRRMERKGTIIHWIDGDDYSSLKESAMKYLND